MDEKEYYTFQEVILGLRSEYLKQMELLKNLKQFCEKDENRVDNFRFYLEHEGKEPLLRCIYDERLNALQKIIKKFKEKHGIYTLGGTSDLKLDNNTYEFYNKTFPVYLPKNKEEMHNFYNSVNAILNSSFSQAMAEPTYVSKLNSELESAFALIYSDMIEVSTVSEATKIKNGLLIPRSWIEYCALDDEIVMVSEGELDDKILEYILKIGFPTSELNEYQKKIIAESEDTYKPVRVESLEPAPRITLQIEENNGFVLTRKK